MPGLGLRLYSRSGCRALDECGGKPGVSGYSGNKTTNPVRLARYWMQGRESFAGATSVQALETWETSGTWCRRDGT